MLRQMLVTANKGSTQQVTGEALGGLEAAVEAADAAESGGGANLASQIQGVVSTTFISLKDYRQDFADLTPNVQSFIRDEILPAQVKTHAMMSKLQERA